MNDRHALYRTLIRGELVQTSALSIGGAAYPDTGQDICYRDGLHRLTIRGTSLAGAMIETATRLLPDLIPEGTTTEPLLKRRITGKRRKLLEKEAPLEDFVQSVWCFRHLHPSSKAVPTEWRQGVGIRQATGAAAAQKRALYDYEVVPTGTRWPFLLEIDTFRGAEEAEALAVLALDEWTRERCWLGRGAARGTGWMKLDKESLEVLRLPCCSEAIEAWPDSSLEWPCAFEAARRVAAEDVAEQMAWQGICQAANVLANTREWVRGQWQYLTVECEIAPGQKNDGHGWDPLQVSGHPADLLGVHQDHLLRPQSIVEAGGTEWLTGGLRTPDSPFVCTTPQGKAHSEPFLPGGGLRGPLRHAASGIQRGVSPSKTIIDPNQPDAPDNTTDDPVADLFGLLKQDSRLLVRDANLITTDYVEVRAERHAEDEFTAGAYGSSKFDRNVLLSGIMQFVMVVEAPNLEALKTLVKPLIPALELARLGHLPIGGGKWTGHGWIPWKFTKLNLAQAGEEAGRKNESVKDRIPERLDDLWRQVHQADATPDSNQKEAANVQ